MRPASLALGIWLFASTAGAVQTRPPSCVLTVGAAARLPARIDTVATPRGSGSLLALAGPSGSRVAYLPHDTLLVLDRGGRIIYRLPLPRYVTPPSVVVGSGSSPAAVVVDTALLLFDPATGRLESRRALDVQPLGWPAAMVGNPSGVLYVAGQPANGPAAVVEALDMSRRRVIWRARLGLFHAGIWIGMAGTDSLAVYSPGAYDAAGAGSVALLDARTGRVRRAYRVAAPPLALDPLRRRLYSTDGATISALDLDHGSAVAITRGRAPAAVIQARGLLAFARRSGVAVASARTLRVLGGVALSGVTALDGTADGSALLVGRSDGLTRIDLRGCRAQG